MQHQAGSPGSRVPDAGGDVAERVRQVIGEAGCSQREFARRIVMDPSKLSRSLSGSRRFTVAELARIADAGRIDAGWLLGAGPTPSPGPTPNPRPATSPGAGRAAAPVPQVKSRTRSVAVARTDASDGGRPLQIVRETVRLIAEHGFHAVRVSDIAAACDTSTAAIHYHFPGRAELLEAAVRWCMDEDTARRAALSRASGSARAEETPSAGAATADRELRQLIALQTPRTEQQRRQWLVWLDLWAEAARSTAVGRLHADFYRQWRRTVADVIRRGIAQGVFRTVDPEFSALRLTALIDGLATQVLAAAPGEGGTTVDDMYAALIAYVDTELAAEPR
ncbi:TetR family transcriptional regulator C-terminal domain-containing protein [Streptomyces pathocidini]|uniref:TetR family transcriptional regulator C-terminal domain-containing protein n=1 Tax=Streptomyces pathocidini TaxID=1650571 RepID=A0ABW7URE0_9ACTN